MFGVHVHEAGSLLAHFHHIWTVSSEPAAGVWGTALKPDPTLVQVLLASSRYATTTIKSPSTVPVGLLTVIAPPDPGVVSVLALYV